MYDPIRQNDDKILTEFINYEPVSLTLWIIIFVISVRAAAKNSLIPDAQHPPLLDTST